MKKNIIRVLKALCCSFLIFTIINPVTSIAYTNHFELDDQWEIGDTGEYYGIGDPYVFKFNGLYYLIPSTANDSLGFKMWTSPDLVNWTYAGNVGVEGDTLTKGAYAPEITYWNGIFYLYSATPSGAVNRVFTATNPLGPYEYKADLSGTDWSIDGSVFIDDDENATKYFFDTGGNCIRRAQLNDNMISVKNPTKMNGITITGNWTEGPSVFKRQGKYYMTYTGNHVLLDSYMVEYAVGDSVASLAEPKNNRLLISTDGKTVGLGHNSVVVGPDLDSYYIVYHSLVSTNGPQRRMDIDQLVFNGDTMSVLGPTTWETQDPTMPDFYDYVSDNSFTTHWKSMSGDSYNTDSYIRQVYNNQNVLAVSNSQTAGDYTAEFNVRLSNADTAAGGMISYTDENNYAYAYIDSRQNQICLEFMTDSVSFVTKSNLPSGYIYNSDVNRKITVKKQDNLFDIYIDDRLCLSSEDASHSLNGGKIGLCTAKGTALFGYSAFSDAVNGNMDSSAEKPTDVTIQAVHANETSRVFDTYEVADTWASASRNVFSDIGEGDWLTYVMNAQADGLYVPTLRVKTSGATIRIKVNDETVLSSVEIPDCGDGFSSISLSDIAMDSGQQNLTIEILSGEIDFSELYVIPDQTPDVVQMDQDELDFSVHEGTWQENDGTWTPTQNDGIGKMVAGSEYWNDYTIEATIDPGANFDAGILFRLRYSAPPFDTVGIPTMDYHQGYYAFISQNRVYLAKQNFSWSVLGSAPATISNGTDYNLKVEAYGNEFKIYLDGVLMIDYIDTDYPFITGKIGLRSRRGSSYKNISISFPPRAARFNLNSLINQSDGIELAQYEYEGKDAFISLLARAKELLANDDATQYEIVLMIDNLEQAIDALTLIQESDPVSQKYKVDLDNKIIKKVPARTTVDEFKRNISAVSAVYDDHGSEITDGTKIISSKMTVKFTANQYTFKIWVRGDVNNDGQLDIVDMMAVRNVLMGAESREEFMERSYINGDAELDIADMLAVRNIIIGTIT